MPKTSVEIPHPTNKAPVGGNQRHRPTGGARDREPMVWDNGGSSAASAAATADAEAAAAADADAAAAADADTAAAAEADAAEPAAAAVMVADIATRARRWQKSGL